VFAKNESFVNLLSNSLNIKDLIVQQRLTDLEIKIGKLNLQGKELQELKADLEKLKNQKLSSSIFDANHITDLYKAIGILQPSESFPKFTEALKIFQNIGKSFIVPTNLSIPTGKYTNPIIKPSDEE